MRAAALSLIALTAGCLETASAQTPPRADAGARPARAVPPRRAVAPSRELLRALGALDPDAGLGGLFGSYVGDAFGTGGLGGIGYRLRTDGGAPPPALGTISLGTRGVGSGTGDEGMGGMGLRRPPQEARFEALETRGPTARWRVVSELSHQGPRIHGCLVAAGRLAPSDVPLRFRIRAPTGVEALELEGAPPALERCAREHLGRALFGPSEPPTEVSARLRVGPSPAR